MAMAGLLASGSHHRRLAKSLRRTATSNMGRPFPPHGADDDDDDGNQLGQPHRLSHSQRVCPRSLLNRNLVVFNPSQPPPSPISARASSLYGPVRKRSEHLLSRKLACRGCSSLSTSLPHRLLTSLHPGGAIRPFAATKPLSCR